MDMDILERKSSSSLRIGLAGLLLAAVTGGCGPSSPDATTGGDQEAKEPAAETAKAAPLDPAAEADRGFAELQRRLAGMTDLRARRSHLRSFLDGLRASEAKAKTTFPVTFQVQGLIETTEKAIEAEKAEKIAKVEVELRKIQEKVAKGELTDFNAAHEIIKKAEDAARSRDDSDIAAGLEDLKAKVLRWDEAERDYQVRLYKLKAADYRDDPVKKIALLAGFPPQFDDTPQAVEIKKLIDENYRIYGETRDERTKKMTEVNWQNIDVRSHRPLWPDTSVPIEVEEKENVLVVGPNKEDYDEKDSAGTCITFGEDDWIDVEIHFEARLTAPDSIFFGARGHEDSQGRFGFQWAGLEDFSETGDEWHSIVVKIEGTSFAAVDTTGKKSVRKDIRVTTGPFGIRVVGDKAQIRIRNLKVAVLKSEKAAAEPGEGDEGKKDDGKKDD